jgi:hypothetical protein
MYFALVYRNFLREERTLERQMYEKASIFHRRNILDKCFLLLAAFTKLRERELENIKKITRKVHIAIKEKYFNMLVIKFSKNIQYNKILK